MMYKITLADGTTLENLVLNGNNFIAQTAVDDAVFKDNMAIVIITNLEDGSTEAQERRAFERHRPRRQVKALMWKSEDIIIRN